MTRRRRLGLLPACLLTTGLGCDPDPLLVGAGLPTASWNVDWRANGSLGGVFHDVAAMPDGGAAVVSGDQLGRHLVRYAPDGTETFSVLLPCSCDRVLTSGDQLFVTGSEVESIAGQIHRAGIWRLSDRGEVEASYVHPRPGTRNSFGEQLAEHEGDVALLVVNASGLAPGESPAEVLRLSYDLEPVGAPLPFSSDAVDLGFDDAGQLLILEARVGVPSLVHTADSATMPARVDCDALLADGGPPLCTSTLDHISITNLDDSEVLELGSLGFDGTVYAVRGQSPVFYGTLEGSLRLRVVAVTDDGTVTREVEVSATPDTEHTVAFRSSSSRADDGALFVTVQEHKVESLCTDLGADCTRGSLLKLTPAP